MGALSDVANDHNDADHTQRDAYEPYLMASDGSPDLTSQNRLRVLISAYACEPGRGSEPGVGWNVAVAMAEYHDVWVLTRANNRPAIEQSIDGRLRSNLNFAYVDLPRWASWWKHGARGVQAYYYLWQIAALPLARALHRSVRFDLVHHVTFAKYWAPTFLGRLGVPLLWGPVGGGETTPSGLLSGLSAGARRYERLRAIARRLGELDPMVRATARQSAIGLATTPATAQRMRALGARDVRVLPAIALAQVDINALSNASASQDSTVRFISMGNLLGVKGTRMGLLAFARARLSTAEYVIVGDGPERRDLEQLVEALDIASRVRFLGAVTRDVAFGYLRESDILVHPSVHDSGGLVCLEAMAAGKPVICLDVGGPAVHVSNATGILVTPTDPESTVQAIADGMNRLFRSRALREELGAAGRGTAIREFSWSGRARTLNSMYRSIA